MRKIIYIVALLALFFSLNGCKANEISPLSPGEESLIKAVITRVNLDTLYNDLEVLSGHRAFGNNSAPLTILSRNSANSGNDLAEEYLKNRLKIYCQNVTIENFKQNGNNILAVLPGIKYPDKKIIICAHYDDMPAGSLAPGADDNASGCAIVVEAARVLSKYQFNYTIIFALWDFEEQGLLGSSFHAANARNGNNLIEAVLNVDMIGYDKNNDNILLLTKPEAKFPVALAEKAEMINKEFEIGLTPQTTTAVLSSDHIPFLKNNYNSIMFIEDVFSDKNPNYHTENDLASGINNAYFFKCSKLIIASLAYLANRD